MLLKLLEGFQVCNQQAYCIIHYLDIIVLKVKDA
jgi:hypothetical protein